MKFGVNGNTQKLLFWSCEFSKSWCDTDALSCFLFLENWIVKERNNGKRFVLIIFVTSGTILVHTWKIYENLYTIYTQSCSPYSTILLNTRERELPFEYLLKTVILLVSREWLIIWAWRSNLDIVTIPDYVLSGTYTLPKHISRYTIQGWSLMSTVNPLITRSSASISPLLFVVPLLLLCFS